MEDRQESKIIEIAQAALSERFVANKIFSDKDLALLHNEAKKILYSLASREINTRYYFQDEIIAVSCIYLLSKAKDIKNNGVYEYLANLYGTSNLQKFRSVVCESLKNLDEKNKMLFLKDAPTKYYSTLLCHSLAPIDDFSSFIDVCFHSYIEDFRGFFNVDNDKELIDDCFDSLQYIFKKDNCDEILQQREISGDKYNINAGIKNLFISEPDFGKELFISVFQSIDKIYKDEKSFKYSNLIEKRVNDYYLSDSTMSKKRVSSIKRAVNISSISPFYYYKGGEVILVVPSFMLKESNSNNFPYITVKNNGKTIYERELTVCSSGRLILSTEPKHIKLDIEDDLNISVQIELDNKIIYDSKEKLFRECIIFDDLTNKEVRGNTLSIRKYNVFTTDVSCLLDKPEIFINKGRYLYSCQPKNGEYLRTNLRLISFRNADDVNHNIPYISYKKAPVIFDDDIFNYDVVNRDSGVFVVFPSNLNRAEYKVNVKYYKNKNVTDVINLLDKPDILEYKLDKLPFETPLEISIINVLSNKIIDQKHLIITDEIRYSFNKKVFIKYRDNFSNEEIKANISYRNRQFVKICSLLDNELSIPFFDKGRILIPIPILYWWIDNADNKPVKINGDYYTSSTWFKKIVTLNVKIPQGVNVIVRHSASNNNLGGTFDELNNIMRFGLNSILSKNKQSQVSFGIIADGEDRFLFNVMANDSFVDKESTITKKDGYYSFYFNPSNYVGKNCNFEIRAFKKKSDGDYASKVKYKQQLNSSNQQVIDLSGCSDGTYKLVIYSYDDDPFARSQNFKPLLEKDVIIGNFNKTKFKNKKISVEYAFVDSVGKVKIKPFQIDDIKYFKEKDNKVFYKGKIYRKKENRWIYWTRNVSSDVDFTNTYFSFDKSTEFISIYGMNTKHNTPEKLSVYKDNSHGCEYKLCEYLTDESCIVDSFEYEVVDSL